MQTSEDVLNSISLVLNPCTVADKRQQLRILVAEDEPLSQQVCLFMLENLGYTADIVNNGLEALEALQDKTYDLIFMDLWMPEMDGVTATRLIIQNYPFNQRPWIIALTANEVSNCRNKFLSIGMNDYLNKPLQSQLLQSVLEKWGTLAFCRCS